MRGFVIICICLAAAFWADHTYNDGTASGALVAMVHEIAAAYK